MFYSPFVPLALKMFLLDKGKKRRREKEKEGKEGGNWRRNIKLQTDAS